MLNGLYCEQCFHATANVGISLGGKTVPVIAQVASALLPAVPTKATELCFFDGRRAIARGDFARLGSSVGRIVQAVETSGGDVRVMVLHCIQHAAGKDQSHLATYGVSDNIVPWDVASANLERAVAWRDVIGEVGAFLVLSQP